jgi:predicted glycoside hydrolase/deacetylase ChbG (UPF0249 family)
VDSINDNKLKVIINADDYGISSGVTEGIVKGFLEGIVTDTTIMINMDGSKLAVQLAKEHNIPVGLHLVLTKGAPLLPPQEVKTLVNNEGEFKSTNKSIWENLDLHEVKNELEAQVKKFLQTGLELTHIDSHHHVHRFGPILDATMDIAKRLGVPLRQTDEIVKGKIVSKGIVTTDYFISDFYGEGATVENLKRILTTHNTGVIEVMCHPGLPDNWINQNSSYNKKREEELKILTSPEIKRFIREKNLKLISYSDL